MTSHSPLRYRPGTAFVNDAFPRTIQKFGSDRYYVHLKETTTTNIFYALTKKKSETGIPALNPDVKRQVESFIREQGPKLNLIYREKPYVFLSIDHPLADRKSITI